MALVFNRASDNFIFHGSEFKAGSGLSSLKLSSVNNESVIEIGNDGSVDISASTTLASVDIKSGTIDNTDVTVGSGKTLNVSDGTLTTSAAQKLAILQGAGDNVDIGDYDLRAQTLTADGLTATQLVFAGANGVLTSDSDLTFSTDTLTATKIGAFEAAGAINFANQTMTNVNIDSGAIDGATIGANSAAAGTFTTISGDGTITFSNETGISDADGLTVNQKI